MTPPKLTKEGLAQRLRSAREQAGLSQAQVARELRMHRPTVTEIEAGRRSVSAQELAHFSQLYGVDLEWLMGKSGGIESLKTAKARLAARELEKLRPQDLDRLLRLIVSLRKGRAQ